MKCLACDVNYPRDLLQPMFFSKVSEEDEQRYTVPVCGLCALELTNRQLGINRARFAPGSQAESFRTQALMHRRRSTQTARTPAGLRPCKQDHASMQQECYAQRVAADCPECGAAFKARPPKGASSHDS
jgi:hypothetical protein